MSPFPLEKPETWSNNLEGLMHRENLWDSCSTLTDAVKAVS
jgi:hypothetical protein